MSQLYQRLKIDLYASQSEIRRAYLKLAMRYHPDRNRGDKVAEAKFKDIVSAFEILGDPEARALYDQGRIDDNGRPRSGFQDFETGKDFGAGMSRDFARRMWHNAAENFQHQFFHRDEDAEGPVPEEDDPDEDSFVDRAETGPPSDPPPGEDQSQKQYRLSIDFLEACLGTVKHVRLPNKAQFKITVPPGVETGQRLRVNSSGDGAVPFVVKLTVEPHVVFSRLDEDIIIEVPITPYEAYFGVELDVPTLHGPAKITVPPLSLDGDEVVMPEMGVRVKGKAHGDQIVQMKISMPRRWSSEFENAMKLWRQKAPFNPRGKILNLLSK